jgi:hypothetical protein
MVLSVGSGEAAANGRAAQRRSGNKAAMMKKNDFFDIYATSLSGRKNWQAWNTAAPGEFVAWVVPRRIRDL